MTDLRQESLTSDVESGAYFTASRQWYGDIFHSPISERSYYIIVILLALINMIFAVHSFFGVFPVVVPAPFITMSDDYINDLPHIRRLALSEYEDKNVAVMRFLIASYVMNRESWDIPSYEMRYRNIASQSADSVFQDYEKLTDISNPYSFYRLYTNQYKRVIDIESLAIDNGHESTMAHIVFTALLVPVDNTQPVSRSRWQANMQFKYTDFSVDQSLDIRNRVARFFGLTGDALKDSRERRKVVPMKFVVSDYKVKELLE